MLNNDFKLTSTTEHLLLYFRRHWVRYIVGMLLVFGSAWFAMQIPLLLGKAIDLIRNGARMDDVLRTAYLLAGSAVGTFALRIIWRTFVLGFIRGAETYLRQRIFAHLETLSSDFYIKFNTGDIITRAISDVNVIRFMFGAGLVSIIDASTVFIIAAFNMVNTAGFAMSFIAIAPIPFLLFFIVKIRKEIRRRQREIRIATSHMASKIQENLTGIHVIKGFAQEESECADFSGRSQSKWNAEIHMARLSNLIGPVIQVVFGAVFTLFIIFSAGMIADGRMSVGQFTAFNGYILLIINPVSNIGQAIERWQNGLAAIARLDEILLYPPEVFDRQVDEGATVTEGKIEIKGLSFVYQTPERKQDGSAYNRQTVQSEKDDIKRGTEKTNHNHAARYGGINNNLNGTKYSLPAKPALRNVSINIRPGEVIAVTGPTGCGKSTLISLLARQWAVGDGMIYIDGRDVNRIPVKTLRAAIGYVPQDNFLFSVSIMENIRFYDEKLTDDDIYAAAGAVSVHDSIISFSDGYDTVVGERGVTLSGGQMQRIAIARALSRKPKILLLDDCFSAVDAETEKAILEGLRQYLRNTTAIIITHRVASAALADRIFMLDEEGAGAELGTYDELVAMGGRFGELVKKQTGRGHE